MLSVTQRLTGVLCRNFHQVWETYDSIDNICGFALTNDINKLLFY